MKPKRTTTWRTCPECGSKATKIFNLNTGLYKCQVCDHQYFWADGRAWTVSNPPRIAILIKNDGSAEHIVNIDGRPHRVWEGTLPSGQEVHVVVQSIRPLPGASDAEANHVRAELEQYLDGLTHSNLRPMTRAEYVHF